MKTAFLTNLAENDLIEIWNYGYDNFGELEADKYYDQIIKSIELIRANEDIGSVCDYIRHGYKKYIIRKHIIFYKVEKEKILIVRILHSKMDVSNMLS